MLSYKVAISAVRFTQERIDLLNTARRLVEALRVMLDNLMYPHMPYGDMDAAEEDFHNTRTNVQKLLYKVLLPSLQNGGYGYIAMEDESLRPVFESLGPSAREQKQKMQRLVRGIREELGEAFGIESDSWPEPSISLTEAVATEEPGIEKQENGAWVGLPTESDLEREIEAWKQSVTIFGVSVHIMTLQQRRRTYTENVRYPKMSRVGALFQTTRFAEGDQGSHLFPPCQFSETSTRNVRLRRPEMDDWYNYGRRTLFPCTKRLTKAFMVHESRMFWTRNSSGDKPSLFCRECFRVD